MKRVERHRLQVAAELVAFIEDEALPGTGVDAAAFWEGFSRIAHDMAAENRTLLDNRAVLQGKLDEWHRSDPGPVRDMARYRVMLEDIGYIVPEGPAFSIGTEGTDAEIALIPGPQLVVPVTNARYALNAANARWGSLYDALYGTDALGDAPTGTGYDPLRGGRVISWAKAFLDRVLPLAEGSWEQAAKADAANGRPFPTLKDESLFVGRRENRFLFCHNGLGIILDFTSGTEIAASDLIGLADIKLEAAVTAIMDLEDSVACVDAEDKVAAYRNWLGLMKGDLAEEVTKGGRTFTRALVPDDAFETAEGVVRVRRRALMLVRNVGLLMTNPAIHLESGGEIFEGLMDAAVAVLIALHDLQKPEDDPLKNSLENSVYVVKPKLHGPEETAFSARVFDRVETMLGLPVNTVKLGIMDEERRTSVNLKECIRAAKDRVAFINTGFLDRTGDEIRTSMEAGPMIPKGEMKGSLWIRAYEDRNVDIGLACGLSGKAQIGKGMWAMPDRMADMLSEKGDHPKAGANTAWVPSPTAATLHATHYHDVDVFERQREIAEGGQRGSLGDLLTIPLAAGRRWSDDEITSEVENNAQGILGYVVRWINQGVGCSKVPDIHDIGLMEDRATCRISSQALANWLRHGVVTEDRVRDALRRMAVKVDAQNAGDPTYRPMAPSFDGAAFRAASDLVFEGIDQPSGYTEPILHRRRLELKQS